MGVLGDNRRFWGTFVSIGVKAVDPDYGPIYVDDTSSDPDFGLRNNDGLGSPALQANDFVAGGWFNANPPNLQGAAVAGPNGFETFIAQLSIHGLAPGAQVWAGGGDAPGAATTWFTDILRGERTVFRQGDVDGGEDSAVGHTVFFDVPTPGSIAIFGAAGVIGLRRRRA